MSQPPRSTSPRPPASSSAPRAANTLALIDRVGPSPAALFVGINPGVRSATVGHHFAGHSNRFWRLLHESGVTPVLLRADEDTRLLEWGYGVTNLVPRPTPGIDTLTPSEYADGLVVLRRKVRRWKPTIVVLLGVTLFRFVFDRRSGVAVVPGLQAERFEGAAVFVLPNPSGRNAHFSYAEMLAAFHCLRLALPPRQRARR